MLRIYTIHEAAATREHIDAPDAMRVLMGIMEVYRKALATVLGVGGKCVLTDTDDGKTYTIMIGPQGELNVEITKSHRVSGCKMHFEFGEMTAAPVAKKSCCSAKEHGECCGLESCVLEPTDIQDLQVRAGLLSAQKALHELVFFLLEFGKPVDFSMSMEERNRRAALPIFEG